MDNKNNNQKRWEEEYQKPKLITQSLQVQKDFLRFIHWLKKNKHLDFERKFRVLDLGCGIGKNAFYLAKNFPAELVAYDFSQTAIEKAKKKLKDFRLEGSISFELRDIRKKIPLEDHSIDLALDIMSSHNLSKKERDFYLRELYRIMKPGAFLYWRTFAKEGDKNAKALLKKFPGSEEFTYIHPELGVQERIFSGPEIKEIYAPYFRVVRMLRKTGYQKFNNQVYKRNYWNVYLQRNEEIHNEIKE